MIIIQVRAQQWFEMSLIEDDDVIQQFSAKATDYAFNIGVGLSCQMHPMQSVNHDVSA